MNSSKKARENLYGGVVQHCMRIAVRTLAAFTLLVALPTNLMAQEKHTVSGTIVGASDNQPIPGASVAVKGTTMGVVTDVDGKFSIEVTDQDALVFSFVGYKSQTVSVAGKTTFQIVLQEDVNKLDELVVVGYGAMKRSDLSGSVISVTGNELKKSVATSFDQAIQGRVSGVTVTQNNGQPGGSVSIRIRGISTINNNEPLYIIDGVPVSGNNSSSLTSNALSGINPADIASMEILKDASATAIYGSRASNGVIIITTRKGEKGKSRVSYDGYYGIQSLPKYLPTLTLREYAQFYNERAALRGFDSQTRFNDPSKLGDGTNWQKEMFNNASMQNHQISVSGANDKTSFYLSGAYFTQDGIAIGSDFNRYSVNLSVDNQTRDWLKIGANIMASRYKQTKTTSEYGLVNMALRQTPDVPVRNLDGSFGGASENIYGTYTTNPVGEALMRENYDVNSQVLGNLYADITILKGLSFRNEIGGTISYFTNHYFQPETNYGEYEVASSGSRTASNSLYWNMKNILTYNKKIGVNHDITLMIGHESQESNWESLSGSISGYITNENHEFGMADYTTSRSTTGKSKSSIESYFSRLNYVFADKYILTATYRLDGSSNFGTNNKWGKFPSFAAAWRINKEAFMSNISQIDNLKLRLGWGLVGNQAADGNQYISVLNSSQSGLGVGQLPDNIPNTKIRWESTSAYNVGLDLNMFQNRIEFIADLYYKSVSDLLMQIELPQYLSASGGTGQFSKPWVNIGGMENKGLEFTLNTVNIDNGGFSWRSGFTFFINRNKLTKLNSDNAHVPGYITDLNNSSQLITYSGINRPFGEFYGYEVIGMFNKESDFYTTDANGNQVQVAIPDQKGKYGIDPSGIWVGDYRYKDQNSDGTIDESDRTYIGNPEPKFEYGINNTFTYMGFDLSVNIHGVYGNKIYNMTRQNFSDPNSNLGMLNDVLNYARIGYIDGNTSNNTIDNVYITNEGTMVPRISLTSINANTRLSNLYVEDGSYLRVKNIILGYTVPEKITNKLKIDGVRIYVNAQNVYTLTKYKGYDPEIGLVRQSVKTSGIDQGRYPSQFIVNFGLSVNF
jgi:TonB-dependent starch-binding outer membrane protein SusC